MKTIEEIEAKLKKEELNNIYLFFGEEQYLLENTVKKIKKIFGECIKGINFVSIDDTNVNQLIPNIETPPFGYEKKLIIAKNTGLFKRETKPNSYNEKLKEQLKNYIKENQDIIKESTVLLFIENEVDTRLSLYKTIDSIGNACKFEFQKPQQIVKRMQSICCKAYGVTIDSTTVMYFIECCGTNMQELINEIRKLIEYVGKGGTITKAEIDLLSTKKIETIVFDLTDSICKKSSKGESIQILRDLIYMKEPIQKILVIIYNNLKKLYFVKIAEESNKNVAEALNLKPNQQFLVSKYVTQARGFDKKQLRELIQKIRDLDYQYKSR